MTTATLTNVPTGEILARVCARMGSAEGSTADLAELSRRDPESVRSLGASLGVNKDTATRVLRVGTWCATFPAIPDAYSVRMLSDIKRMGKVEGMTLKTIDAALAKVVKGTTEKVRETPAGANKARKAWQEVTKTNDSGDLVKGTRKPPGGNGSGKGQGDAIVTALTMLEKSARLVCEKYAGEAFTMTEARAKAQQGASQAIAAAAQAIIARGPDAESVRKVDRSLGTGPAVKVPAKV